jgi:hypothetical protein
MITAALLLVAQVLTPTPAPSVSPVSGYGPWRLGMSKEEVKAASEFGPYSSVASTGGLETRNGLFADQKTTISFVFGDGGLRIIQIWAYEGKDLDQAVSAFYRVYQHLEVSRGAVETPGLSVPEHASSQTFTGIIQKALAGVPPNRAVKIQIIPLERLPEINIFSSLMKVNILSSLIKQPQSYYVFLYYRAP